MMFKFTCKDNDQKFSPIKAHETDAGFDLKARSGTKFDGAFDYNEVEIKEGTPLLILPGDRYLIKTGVFIELVKGWEAQVRARSGLALKNGIQVVNSPGTIDAGYRNEIGVIIYNSGKMPFLINKYDRIAQFVIKEVPEVDLSFIPFESFNNNSDRGTNGFGSTGVTTTEIK